MRSTISPAHPWRRAARLAILTAALAATPIVCPAQAPAQAPPHPASAPSVTEPPLPASRPTPTAPRSIDQIMSDYGTAGLDYPPAIPLNITPLRTTQLLVDALARDKTASGQAQFLTEIGQTQHAEGASAIRAYLTNPDPLLRAAAARAAGTLGSPALAPDVKKLLDDSLPAVRQAALIASLQLTAAETDKAALVERGLGDADPTVVLAALHHAVAANAATIAAKLPDLAKHPTLSTALQVQALHALGRLHATAQAGAVAPLLKGPLAVKSAAIQTLGQMNATDQTPAVLALLSDPHPTVRRNAMDAIARLAEPAVQQQHALKLLADPDPTVRQAAARIFGPHPLPEAVEPLVRQLNDPYRPLHNDARQSLTTYTTPAMRDQIVAAAVKLLHDPNPRRQEDGSFLLGAMKSEADLDAHIALLTFRTPGQVMDWELYTQAIWSLGEIGNPKAAPLLLPLLKNVPVSQGDLMGPRGSVSTVAGEAGFVAAAQLGFKAAVPEANRVLRAAAAEQSPDMRAAAAWALGTLTAPSDQAATRQLLKIAQEGSDVEPARFEVIKCLVRRTQSPAPAHLTDALKTLATSDTSPLVRFAAHWAWQHLTAQTLPYTPPDAPWKPTTSIEDLTPNPH